MNISTFVFSILFIMFVALVGNESRLFTLGPSEVKRIKVDVIEESDESVATTSNQIQLAKIEFLAKRAIKSLSQNDEAALWELLNQESAEVQKGILVQVTSQLNAEQKFDKVEGLLLQLPQSQRIEMRLQFDFARALSKQAKLEAAISEYKALLGNNPSHQAGAINLGILLNRQDKHLETIRLVTPTLSLSAGKKKAKLLSLLGSSHKALNRLSKAEKLYLESINYRPGHAATWLNLAQVQKLQKRPYQQVKLTYKRAISLAPEQHSGLLELGEIALQAGEFDVALRTLNKAVELNPQHSKTRLKLAWALFENNQREESLQQWNWLDMHGSRKSYRLTAQHMQTILNGEENHLKPLRSSQNEKLYVQAIDLAMQQQWKASLVVLNKIDTQSPFYVRSLLRQKTMQQQLGNSIEVNRLETLIKNTHMLYDGSAFLTPDNLFKHNRCLHAVEQSACVESIFRNIA